MSPIQSRSKLISLAEAVRRYSWDGMQYASGAALPVGSDAIIFGRELHPLSDRLFSNNVVWK